MLAEGDGDSEDSDYVYSHLEEGVVDEVPLERVTDFTQILDSFWPVSLQLRTMLRSQYRTAQQYDYHPDMLDMSILLGWCMSSWGVNDRIIPAAAMHKAIEDLQVHFDSQGVPQRSAENFIEEYIDNTEVVPIVIRAPSGFLLDHESLLLHLIYLQGCTESTGSEFINRDSPLLQTMKGRVAEKFETWLRNEVHKRGWTGPDEAVNEKYEYDILAISEENKIIVLADAKFRDIAPSSLSGENLVPQELLADHGLGYESERQQVRLNYFLDNPGRFAKYLNPKRPWNEYEVRSYLVTKHIPLAHRYKETRIVTATEFLETGLV